MAVGQYMADIGMSLIVPKCACATTAHNSSIMVHLDPNNAVTPWSSMMAKSNVPYQGVKLDHKGLASMNEKHLLHCEALLGRCKNALGPASVPHEVIAAVVGGIVRYAAPYMSDTAAEIVRLNVAIKNGAVRFENVPIDVSNVVVRSSKGVKLAHIQVLCRESVVAIVAHLTHHRSAVTKGGLQALLDDLHAQHGV